MPTTLDMVVLATAMVDMLAMPDTDMLPPMPMVPTTERGLLMLSLRLMPMPTTLDMVVLAMAMVDMLAMPDTDMLPPMPMVPTTERGLLMPSPRLMLTMELTDMVSPMLVSTVDTDTGLMV